MSWQKQSPGFSASGSDLEPVDPVHHLPSMTAHRRQPMEKRRLRALDEFRCLADRCTDNCCGDWRVEVDEKTLRKWQGLPGEERAELMSHVDTRREDGKTVTSFRQTEDGNCCLLGDGGLCRLQAARSAEVLPLICREYPRTYLQNPLRKLSAATLSCPEMARLVLDGDGPLFSVEDGGEEGAVSSAPGSVERGVRALDAWVLRAMELRWASLEQRVFYIASVIGRLYARRSAGGRAEDLVEHSCGDPESHLRRIAKAAEKVDVRRHAAAGGAYWKAVYDLYEAMGLNAGRTSIGGTPLGKALAGAAGDEDGYEMALERYLECRGKARKEWETIGPRLERYLSFSFMAGGFPWNPLEQNHVSRLLECLTPLSLVMLAVYALGGRDGGSVTPDLLCEIVWKAERHIGHSDLVSKDLLANLHKLQIHHYAPLFLLF
jgi:hypothetical protein